MPKGDKTVNRYNYDWIQLYADFSNASIADDRITLKAWCEPRNLNYSNVSKQFAELARLQTAEIGATLAPKAMRKLGALLQSKDENIAHKTSTAILDRTGFSPKEQAITINTNISLGIFMFSKDEMPDINDMFKGAILDEA